MPSSIIKNKDSQNLNKENADLLREQLKRSEERFFKAFYSSPVPMTIAKLPEGRWIYANDSFLKLTEYSLNEVIGHTSSELNLIVPDERQKILNTLNAQGNLLNKEFTAKTKFGKIIQIINSSVVIDIDGKDHAVTLFYDLTDRKKAEETLKESENNLIEAQKLAGFGNYSFDLEKHISVWSDQMYEIWEIDKSKGIPALDEVWKLIHPDDRENLANILSIGKTNKSNIETEFRILFPDGRIKYVQLIVKLIFNEAGELIKRRGVEIDITERKSTLLKLEDAYEQIKERLQEKEILMREIFHRTKNNMQLISSLLSLKASVLPNGDMLNIIKDVQDRIRAISLVHEILYKGDNLSKVNLKEYIISLGDLMLTGNKIEFKYELEEISVFIDTAIPCGLVITELILNSKKHAFPGERTGYVEIKLTKTEELGVLLMVSDNGIGIHNSNGEIKEKIGLQLFRSIVEDQLGGKIDLNVENGVKWTITFRNVLYSERV